MTDRFLCGVIVAPGADRSSGEEEWNLEAHSSLGLEGSKLSWAGQGWARWTLGAYPACQWLANTEDAAHAGAGPWHCSIPAFVHRSLVPMLGWGQGTLELVTELKVNVAMVSASCFNDSGYLCDP